MAWSKLKSIILVILLAANFFLLALVCIRELPTAQMMSEAQENTLGVLEKNGILMDSATVPEELDLAPLTVTRSREEEELLALALVGSDQGKEDVEGTVYSGEKGELYLSRSGSTFSATFAHQAYPLGVDSSMVGHGVETMERFGFVGEVTNIQQQGEEVVLTLCQQIDGVSIFNCTAQITYSDGQLVAVESGSSRLPGTPVATPGEGLLSVSTVLLQFVADLGELGDVCSQIFEMTGGYQLSTGFGDTTTLTPVWRITTDTGIYILDATSGALSRA